MTNKTMLVTTNKRTHFLGEGETVEVYRKKDTLVNGYYLVDNIHTVNELNYVSEGDIDWFAPYPNVDGSDSKAIQIGGDHYKRMKIQPIEYINGNNLDFCEGSVIKYVSRHQFKNGKEDLLKAKQMIDFLIEKYYG